MNWLCWQASWRAPGTRIFWDAATLERSKPSSRCRYSGSLPASAASSGLRPFSWPGPRRPPGHQEGVSKRDCGVVHTASWTGWRGRTDTELFQDRIVAANTRHFPRQRVPALHRSPRNAASDASLHRRLETALERIRQLRDKVADLTRKLETAHGEIRRLRTLGAAPLKDTGAVRGSGG